MSWPAHIEVSPMQRTIRSLAFAVAAFAITAQSASAGQFKQASYYSAGQRPYRLVAAELTNSGNLDLAIADWLSSQIVILLGSGDGTFQPPRKFSAVNPVGIATGDFDEDGNLDLAVVEANGTGDGSLAVFLGDGQGGFKLSTKYPIGVASSSIALGDFDGDGHLDAAVSDQGIDNTPGDVIVFFGNGRGKLRRVAKFKMPHQQPTGIAAGDLNGDQHPDLAVTLAATGSVAVLINDGKGKFLNPVTYDAGGGAAVDVKIADLRNNGDQDLAIANASQGLVVLLNKGNGTFGKPNIYAPTCQNCVAPMACVVADFNLDDKRDVACATNIDDSYLFYGKGNGKFGPSIPINNTINFQGGFSIATGDFNNDQAPDLAIPIELKGKVAIMLNTK
jgi:FG-GAP-like repeat